MPNITQLTIAKLQPTGLVQYIRDSTLQGFGIKVTAKGKASYFAEARVKHGRTVRKTIAPVELMPLDEARNKARELLLKLKKGVDVGKLPPPTPPADNSLQHVFGQYLANRVNLRPATKHDYHKVMSNCFSDLLPADVTTISKETISAKYASLRATKNEAYCRKAFRTLKAVLNSSGLTINPVSQFQKASGVSTGAIAKTRFLRSHEIAHIAEFSREDTAHQHGQDWRFLELLMFYLYTGCRKGEALSLLKSDYDTANEQLTFRETKNGRPHTIPVVGHMKHILFRAMDNSQSDRIFDYSDATFRTKLTKSKQALGFDDWTAHDLRRTFAEHCQLIGVDQAVIASALNHTPVGVTANAYLGGGLAKLSMLRDVYERLQDQYRKYWADAPDTIGKLPDNWDSDVSEETLAEALRGPLQARSEVPEGRVVRRRLRKVRRRTP